MRTVLDIGREETWAYVLVDEEDGDIGTFREFLKSGIDDRRGCLYKACEKGMNSDRSSAQRERRSLTGVHC